MFLAILVAIRDVFLALALAWVGVTMESRADQQETCAAQSCSDQDR